MTVAAILNVKGHDVITAAPDVTLQEIAEILARNKIGSIVVAGADGEVLGIVSERDVVRAIGESGPGVLHKSVSDYMTKNVVTCRQEDTIATLMSEMTKGRFRHMPVVENNRLVGLISIGDVVKVRIQEAEQEAEAMRAYIATG